MKINQRRCVTVRNLINTIFVIKMQRQQISVENDCWLDE